MQPAIATFEDGLWQDAGRCFHGQVRGAPSGGAGSEPELATSVVRGAGLALDVEYEYALTTTQYGHHAGSG